MKKKILIGTGLALLVVIVIAVVVVGFFLGNIVKAGMETVGPKVTQTTLTIGAIHVGILTGSGGVDNLVLGNPDEYKAKSPTAINVGKAAVRLVPGSLLSDKIVIKSIELRSPEISFDGNPFGANNLQKIMGNVNAFTGGAQAKAANPNTPATPAEKKAGKKLEVDDFLITGAKVHANVIGIPGVAIKEITVPLPDIHLTGLGTGPDGITAGDLTQKILGEITVATVRAVGDAATQLGKDATDAATGAVRDAGKNLGDRATKLGKSFGGLLGK
jgi:hypothetical protein